MFCKERYDFDDIEYTISEKQGPDFEAVGVGVLIYDDFRYLFILLCALENDDVFQLLNFFTLFTDDLTYTKDSINELIKELIENIEKENEKYL